MSKFIGYIHFLLCSLLYELYLQKSVEVKTHQLYVLLRLNELILTCSKALSKYQLFFLLLSAKWGPGQFPPHWIGGRTEGVTRVQCLTPELSAFLGIIRRWGSGQRVSALTIIICLFTILKQPLSLLKTLMDISLVQFPTSPVKQVQTGQTLLLGDPRGAADNLVPEPWLLLIMRRDVCSCWKYLLKSYCFWVLCTEYRGVDSRSGL